MRRLAVAADTSAAIYRYLVRCEAARFDRRVKKSFANPAGPARRQARKERGW
ncbi:MAG: hypothetical protein ABSE16_20295 [Verrucomicrobiota bacterium]